MPYEICRHIKANGTFCKAPCVTDSFWCYFHARMHSRHRTIREAKATVAASPLVFPVLEDRESIQVAASLVACALALGRIDEKRASTILKALALSARNLTRRLDIEHKPHAVARSYTPTLDGLDLGPRQMSDNSTPRPTRPANPPNNPNNRVPHLRDSLIVAKMGIERRSLSLRSLGCVISAEAALATPKMRHLDRSRARARRSGETPAFVSPLARRCFALSRED